MLNGRKTSWSRLLSLLAISTALALVAPPATASHITPPGVIGGFEVDGNFIFPTAPAIAGETRDWDGVGSVTRIDDPGNDPADDVFTDGSKESDPDTWLFTNAAATTYPPKTDITRGYFASDVNPSNAYAWFGFERFGFDGQGNANINFELNQKTTSIVNSKGESIPERTGGDLLVVYDYDGGNKNVNIQVLEWVGTALSGSWTLLSPPPNAAFGDINTSSVSRPGGVFGGGTVAPFRFGEAGLDLSFEVFERFLNCPGFASINIKSRASGQSFNSALRDFAGPGTIDLSTCGKVTVLKEDDAGAPLDGATFTLWKDDGDGVFAAPPDTSAGTCVTGEEGIPGQCTFESVAPGDYFVQETQAPLGYVADPTVTAVTVGTKQTVVVPHTYVDPKIRYRLGLTPAQDTNLVDTDHLFNAHLEKSLDSGANWVDASSETVTFSLSGNGTITSITPGGSISGDGKSGSCVTGGDGACSVTIHSNSPGDSTLTASFDKQTSTTPIDIDENAIKHWVDYRLGIEPDGKTNLRGTSHTFTVTLERTTDGTNYAGVQGASISIQLSGVGSITGNTCGSTDANGQCTVTITSSSTGSTSISASYDAVESNTSRQFTNGAAKNWVDYRVAVGDDDSNLKGEPHTFTVKVEKDTGSGFFALEGAAVALEWNGPAGSGIIGGTCTTSTTDANGECTVIVDSSATGTGTLKVTFTDATLDSGPASFDDSASKTWLDFDLNLTPDQAINEVGTPHTFTVTLRQDSGAGFAGLAGETVSLALSQGGSDATITNIVVGSVDSGGLSGTCTTDSNGQCFVTINASTSGTATLTGSWSKAIGSSSLASESDSGTKTYITGRVTKSSCPDGHAVPGQQVTYSIGFSADGDLTNATLVDELPAEVSFVSASGGGVYNGADHNVTWNLGNLTDGTTGTRTVTVNVLASTPVGTTITNTATFDADVIVPKVATSDLLITNVGASAGGRAFGLSFSILGGTLTQTPDPDTDVGGNQTKQNINVPGIVNDDLLTVFNSGGVTGTDASDTAIATTNEITITAAGATINAKTVVAKSVSSASGFGAGSSRAGSKVQDLTVNGTTFTDITDTKEIEIKDPLSGAIIGKVIVLETIRGGAAAGVSQPDLGYFTSSLTVNSIHVIINDNPLTTLVDETTDIIVASAASNATFPSALACGVQNPSVLGDAFIVGTQNISPDAGGVRVGYVKLGSTGGPQTTSVLDLSPLGTGSGTSFTNGALVPLNAFSSAEVNNLDLLSGGVTANNVKAFSDTDAGVSTGDTTITNLAIAGMPACTAVVDLSGTCEPPPDTVLVLDSGNMIVVLNEQITGAGGLRVNAIHIFVVGAGNPLGLPAGAEVIISSAFSGTS